VSPFPSSVTPINDSVILRAISAQEHVKCKARIPDPENEGGFITPAPFQGVQIEESRFIVARCSRVTDQQQIAINQRIIRAIEVTASENARISRFLMKHQQD
jgi:hypothetical protein